MICGDIYKYVAPVYNLDGQVDKTWHLKIFFSFLLYLFMLEGLTKSRHNHNSDYALEKWIINAVGSV